jgi:putative membrane protein
MWRLILLAPLLLVLILFTLSNTQDVALTLWPFDLAWEVPLSLAVLGFSAVFFLFGALVAWMTSLSARRRAARAEHQLARLQADLAALQAQEKEREKTRTQITYDRALPPAA